VLSATVCPMSLRLRIRSAAMQQDRWPRSRARTHTERVDASAAHACAHSLHAGHVADRPPASVSTPELCPISRCSASWGGGERERERGKRGEAQIRALQMRVYAYTSARRAGSVCAPAAERGRTLHGATLVSGGARDLAAPRTLAAPPGRTRRAPGGPRCRLARG